MKSPFDHLRPISVSSITVQELLEAPAPFDLRFIQGSIGANNEIINKRLNRPQFVLTGYKAFDNYKSIQLMGNAESAYLQSLTQERRIEIYSYMMSFQVPCFIFSDNRTPDSDFLEIAEKNRIAVLGSSYDSVKLQMLLLEFLDNKFAIHASVHGTFVDVCGVGMCFVGDSGIGKSEIALDLVERGHRLVADDVVMLTKKSETIIMGTASTINRHYVNIHGLGIVNVREMFGIRSTRFQKRLEVIVGLVPWKKEFQMQENDPEHTNETIDVFGVKISSILLPINPGKNITVIAESIAIQHLLKTYTLDANEEFSKNLEREKEKQRQQLNLLGKRPQDGHKLDNRFVSWFQFDQE